MAQRDDAGVAWLRSERSRLLQEDARPSSLEDAVGPFIAALDLLDVLPHNLWERFRAPNWERLTNDCARSEPVRVYVLQSGWLSDFQRVLLERIVVDWVDDLADSIEAAQDGVQSTLQQELLQASFRPRIANEVKEPRHTKHVSLIAVVEDQETAGGPASTAGDARHARVGQIIASGLAAASQVLTRISKVDQQGSAKPLPQQLMQDATFAVLQLYGEPENPSTTGSGLLSLLLTAASNITNLAQREKFWQDTIKNLCAVPARVANAMGKDEPPAMLHDSAWFAQLGAQVEVAVATLDQANKSASHLRLVANLLEKVNRSGVLARAVDYAMPTSDHADDFISALLGGIVDRLAKDDQSAQGRYAASWHKLVQALEDDQAATRLVQHVIAYIDQVTFARPKRGELVSDAEKLRAGAEGRTFLSNQNAQASLLVARVLGLFLPRPSAVASGERNAQSSRFVEITQNQLDTEETAAEDLRRWRDIVSGQGLSSSGAEATFSPGMARCLAILSAMRDGAVGADNDFQAEMMETAMARWGTVDRVKRASLAEESYLTTFILSLLAQCKEPSDIPSTTMRSAAFINGVSAHLGHQDPAFRRLGMIVAELLDASVKRNQAPKVSASSKTLEFGRFIWAGKGEGKEACRVLRAMVLGWDASSPVRQQLPMDSSQLRSLIGLKSKPARPIAGQIGIVATLPSTSSLVKTDRRAPQSRTLPPRRPPEPKELTSDFVKLIGGTSDLSILSGSKARRAKPLISAVTDVTEDSTGTGGDVQKLRAYDLPDESDGDKSSSSESDSEDDEIGDDISAPDSKNDNPELLDVHVQKRRDRRRPAYIGELIPLLRSTERKESRKGLKHSEELIRRKTGWGLEIDENAVELALALAALHNNWSTKHFEERRTGALSALIVAAPEAAGGCIIEQYFSGHYSIAQRTAMLNSLVEAARELAERSGEETALVARQTAGRSAEVLVKRAAADARRYGENKYPEVRQASNLNVLRAPQRGVLIQETGGHGSAALSKSGRPVNVARLAGAPVARLQRYIDIASSVFIFPLLNRFLAVLQNAGSRHSRSLTGRRGAGRTASTWQGAGIGSVLSAPAVGCMLDAFAVLASLAQNSLDFQRVIVPELLELSLTTPRAMMPLLGQGGSLGDDDTDDMGRVHEGAMSLAVILVDAARQADGGRFLSREKGMLLKELDMYAGEVFKQEHEKDRGPSANMGRAGRASATLLLRLQEIQS